MIDCAKDVRAYHNQEVTLPESEQKRMRDRRNANRTRLRKGLNKADKPKPIEFVSQGSYAMKTMLRDPDNDYDIDDGVYFRKEDLVGGRGAEMTSLQARQMARDAVDDGKFKLAPEVRSNCVRVLYEAGYHVDLPVYRRVVTSSVFGDVTHYELAASSGWKRSDARDVSKWYEDERAKSADGQQLRRINRSLKKYARSRQSWRAGILSGFGISVLGGRMLPAPRPRGSRALRHDGRDSRPARVESPGRPSGHTGRLHHQRCRRRPGAELPRQADRRDQCAAAAVQCRLYARASARVLGQGLCHDLLQRAVRG